MLIQNQRQNIHESKQVQTYNSMPVRENRGVTMLSLEMFYKVGKRQYF